MKRFADISHEQVALEGVKLRLDDIINKEIEVTGFRINKTKYIKNESEKCLMLQFKLNGETSVLFTGSDVLIRQMEKYGHEVPFLTMIKKVNRYYTFA